MKRLWVMVFCVLSGLNVFSAMVLFSPSSSIHLWVLNKVGIQGKKILSIAYGDLLHNGSLVKVVKSKTAQGVALDFYSAPDEGSRHLIAHVLIPNATDGFYNHRGEAVQLAVVDLDGDGRMELLAPIFNKQMTAYLNPYHFSRRAEGFVPFLLRGN